MYADDAFIYASGTIFSVCTKGVKMLQDSHSMVWLFTLLNIFLISSKMTRHDTLSLAISQAEMLMEVFQDALLRQRSFTDGSGSK